jgi:quercetin 2,3-dioxygenase
MNRKDFIKKGALAAGTVATVSGLTAFSGQSGQEESHIVGFNHLPTQKDNVMENAILHKASTRGHANHGWLDSHHTFSFASYYNPKRMHFGVLRVLNDDVIDGGTGFGMHPHDNMEIISIPLEGALEHKDSMGNVAVIHAGDVQVMSAGTGILHSEFNKHTDKAGKFLQIWVYPRQRNVTPRYDQITLDKSKGTNQLQQILSPHADDDGVWIHQDAWFHMGTFQKDAQAQYEIKKAGNGVYAFVIKGKFNLGGIELETRDGLGIKDVNYFDLTALTNDAEILLMEVPMQLPKI